MTLVLNAFHNGSGTQPIWVGLLVALLCLPTVVSAQSYDEVPSVTGAMALTNVRIVTAPNKVIESGMVIMRDGLIEAVGTDAAVPYDAAHIDGGDSLTVYAGFIDGLSHAGIPKQEDSDTAGVKRPADPPPDQAGIQPDRQVHALVEADHSSIEKLREVGFTAAHVVPRGAMLPGTGALIILDEVDDPNQLVARRGVSLFAQLEGAPGDFPNVAYPSTTMGVLAKMRQLYREAQRRKQLESRYQHDPAGQKRPPYDPQHEAFIPVLNGEQPIAFHTEHPLDIYRVLDLQETLDFPLVMAGLKGAHLALSTLRATDVPLFLTLDLPEAPGDTTASDSPAAAADTAAVLPLSKPGTFFEPGTRTVSGEDTQAERERLERRQAVERAHYYNAADTLRSLNKRFGFSTLKTKPKAIRKNLRTMIKYGLSEEDALAALTVDAARHLGVAASMGTVEPGKMANLVVTEGGSYFDRDSQVRFVFVEGTKFEVEEASPGGEEAAVNPVGTWTIEASPRGGTLSGTLVLTGSPDELSGRLQLADGSTPPVNNLTRTGDSLSFSVDTETFGEVAVDMTVQGDSLDGSVELPNGDTASLIGSRVPR